MTATASRRADIGVVTQVLRDDLDLLEAVPVSLRERAAEECLAQRVRIPKGRWTGLAADALPGGIGLLVLSGLLVRRVGIGGRFGAELLGEGDLLRPWECEDAGPLLSHTTGWRNLEPVELAVLDGRVAYRFARYPALTGRLVGRSIERSRNLATNMAIIHQPRVEVRVHMLLWHLATRWGRVTPRGVVLPLRLTHTVLADLVAARRPTVTGSISDLSRRGLIQAREDGWLLSGDPPGELLELQQAEVAPAGPPGHLPG